MRSGDRDLEAPDRPLASLKSWPDNALQGHHPWLTPEGRKEMFIVDADVALIERAIFNIFEDLARDEAGTSLLYHYTLSSGFYGIVTTKSLFASNISYLNDAQEYKYSISLLTKAFWRAYTDNQPLGGIDPETDGFIQYCIKQLDRMSAMPGLLPYFVSCFSESVDDLSQWRAYGRTEAGLSIGFARPDLQLAADKNDAFLAKVIYDPKLQSRIAAALVTNALAIFRSTMQRNPFARDAIIQECFDIIISRFGILLCLMKDRAFSLEKEWRIVRRDTQGNIRFMPTAFFLKPYIPLSLYGDLGIRQVLAGPGRLSELSIQSARILLENSGYSRIAYSVSRIPYRVVG